ncbi:OTU domain-containing protein 2 [Cytospora mali]|uniref:OTU domain-containing protein 2 n=1 Tax=Cytospora mali TaxID=578113 RepID=A0A194WD06_CYTMA|nr:OTU domain-containing protein 2 [Valsa mali]
MDGGTSETLEQMQARHRKEAKDLQGRMTNKKKNATKKTRKGVNDECAEMERKERLARRAAEQEAAAIAAEQEAANMTDHRGAEKKYMEDEFKKHGLVEQEIRPDGHCLFSAVADQLQQRSIPLGGEDREPGYKTVRRKAAGYIGEHGDEYAGFLEEDLESYVRKMRDTAEWGGQIELLAVANVYGVEIHVVQDRQTEVIRPAEAAAVEGDDKRIWLAYYRHGYGLGEHYNSLRKKA